MQDELVTKLFEFGWKVYPTIKETLKKITPEQIDFLKSIYAAFHGLTSTKNVAEHLEEPRMCALPDTMPLSTNVCKWRSLDITYDVLAWPNQFSKQAVVDAIGEALGRWAAVCGIRPKYTPGNPAAMISVGTRPIDGAYGVLAESELPCGNVQTCHQWYDTGEPWGMFNDAGNGNLIDFIRVATHELGHALGMNHIGSGNLLAPVYSKNIYKPQAGDIAEMVARYGSPAAVTPPPPVGTGSPGDYNIHFVSGVLVVEGYRLTKLEEA